MAAQFDNINLIITLDPPTDSVLQQPVEQIYDDAKQWFLNANNRRGAPFPFRSSGGDPLTPGVDAGGYYFLRNDLGWRIISTDEDQTINYTGNLVGQDNTLPLIIPTPGRTVLHLGLQPVTQRVDEILTSVQASTLNTKYLVESLRDDHQGFGEPFFVDPVLGDDTNSGISDAAPVKSIQYAHDNLVVSGRNDIIYVVNKSGALSTSVGDVVISKDEVHIRGAGRSITVQGNNPGGTIFTIDGNSCSIDALLIDGINLCNYCVVINGRHFKMLKPWIKQAVLDNILIRGGDYHEFIGLETEKAGGAGLALFDAELASGSPREITIDGASNIYLNGGDGIRMDSALANPAGTSTRLIRVRGQTHIFDNVGYGVQISGNVNGAVLSDQVNIYSNTAGAVDDQGMNTIDARSTGVIKRLGLDKMDPMTDVPGGISTPSGDVSIVRTGDGVTSSTLTRQ